MPNFFHIVPVGDNTVFNWDFSIYLMTGTSNNRWENSTRCVISGKTGFAHTRSIVYYQRSYFFVTHIDQLPNTETNYLSLNYSYITMRKNRFNY
ncbi:Acetolactate synthase small subunit [Aphis craccivora]|uniref:Acetolactate synthase small subunit n=1 Tax=Aphis craccivora TaxID=307492 RepID=A0A6G0YI59_APHCR|nr:Acetolactate synthase small subunit [Aphis craccivora]